MALFITLSKYFRPSDFSLSYRSIKPIVHSENFRAEGGKRSVLSISAFLKESKVGLGNRSSSSEA
jgi:hypothetical protein